MYKERRASACFRYLFSCMPLSKLVYRRRRRKTISKISLPKTKEPRSACKLSGVLIYSPIIRRTSLMISTSRQKRRITSMISISRQKRRTTSMISISSKKASIIFPELVLVDFYNQQIEAILWKDDVWVSVKRICENLEIDHATQNKKIKENPSLKERYRDIPIPSKGGNQKTFCIKLEAVTLWLASIQPNRIPDLAKRDRIVRYQVECMQVLTDHFFRSPSLFSFQRERELLDSISRLERNQREMLAQIALLQEASSPPQREAPAQRMPPARSARSYLVERMRFVYSETGEEPAVLWGKLYKEFYYRCHVDIRKKAKNRGVSQIEWAETEGWISTLFEISQLLWP